jgi:hypothetical protein
MESLAPVSTSFVHVGWAVPTNTILSLEKLSVGTAHHLLNDNAARFQFREDF